MRVAIIPARGGSTRIPRKNVREFFGKPIIIYSIETALRSALFDQVYVSTDDNQIRDIAEYSGAIALYRSREMSANEVGTQEVMAYVLKKLPSVDEACCIYATVPMLRTEDLYDGYKLMKKRTARYAFSVGTEPLRDAGMFYWGTARSFIDGHPLISPESVMVPIPENRVCDINTEDDWMRAEQMYRGLNE